MGNAALLTLALAGPSVLGEAEEVPRISAAMFTIGYGFAVVTAVLAGRLWDASGMVVLAVLPFAFTAALTGLLGLTLRPSAATLLGRRRTASRTLRDGDQSERESGWTRSAPNPPAAAMSALTCEDDANLHQLTAGPMPAS